MARKQELAKSCALACGIFALGSIVPAIALAYVLPAEVVLSTIAKRRADIAFTTLIAEGTSQKGSSPPETIWECVIPGRAHRIERKGSQGTEVTLSTTSKRWTFRLGEKATPGVKSAPDLILTFLGASERDSGGSRGSAFLRSRGIDESVVSMARLDKRANFVIGAKPWDLKKPQLWVDKEYFLPSRLIEVDKQTGSVTDTRLLGYGSAVTGEWFPQKVEVYKDGMLVETVTYSSARLNEEVNDELTKPPS
jgi:hypothetical protein